MFRDRTNLVDIRAQRYLESERKFKTRWPYFWLLSLLPQVRAIFIVNTLAYHNARPDSDIDVLIVAAPGTIWTTRFFTTMLAKMLGIRPRPNFTKDTLCLSFYVDAAALNFAPLSQGTDDRHQAYWLSQIFPVYDPHDMRAAICQANPWLAQVLPHVELAQLHPQRHIRHTWLHRCSHIIGRLVTIESFWQKIQLAILPIKLKTLSQQQTDLVLLSNTMLKFHTYDPRPDLQRRWQERMATYGTDA